MSWGLRVSALVVALAGPWLLFKGLSQMARWWQGRSDDVDALIHRAGARWCADGHGGFLDKPDYRELNRAGERRWQEALEAQLRTRPPETPTEKPVGLPASVVRFQ